MKNHSKLSISVKNLILVLVCMISVCISGMPHPSYATTQDDLDRKNAELEDLRERQSALSSDLTELTSQLDIAGRRLSEIDAGITAKQAEMDALQIELDRLDAEKNQQYSTMKLRIQYMYEHSTEDTLELLLQSKSLSELLTRTEYIRQISEYDRRMLAQLEDIFTQETQTQQALAADLEQLNNLKAQAAEEERRVKQLVAETQTKILQNDSAIAETEQLALQYEQQIEADRIAQEEAERNAAQPGGNGPVDNTPVDYDASDLAMLAAIIECEAGNQSYHGMLAVGSVVINRVNNTRFPSSISGVILAAGQFSPVASGRFSIVLARGARAQCVQAAQDVLSGNIVINALYFHVYRPGIDLGGTVIGDHVFF